MLTRRRIIILAIAGVMAAMITVGAVMAQDGGTEEDGSKEDPTTQSLASRVTTTLNLVDGVDLDVEVVESAITEARKEMRSERFELKLQWLIDQGKLDDEQALDLRRRFESKLNDAAGASFGFGTGGRHRMNGGGLFGFHGGHFGHANPEADPSDSSGSSTTY